MKTLKLIDSHAHLEQVGDVAAACDRARDAGVIAIVAVGMDLGSNKKILELAGAYPGYVFAALGMHPWAIDPSAVDETVAFVESHITDCVAVGEIGLDYWIKKDKDLQRKVFDRMLRIATEHGKPVLTHSRGSYEDVYRMVKDSGNKRAVFHWYSGPPEVVDCILESGFFISATPAAEYSEKHRAVIERVPLESLLLETDCPVKYNEVESEPARVRVTLDEVVKLGGEEPEVVARVTTENCIRLFGLERTIA